ncbi:Tad domain-containing protein [Actinocrinis puniceicyclus]|uniref:Tad domain-containing protein n=1 Tax=Actinocrinis puniceicyclus TaxID=977794 RepID=A0A8J8BB17_9ACTN|nr:Tad domain-containing protein [Actinocrinis puniceicyclus]MBS2961975.1 Tad domain-containing protein [Actinocrinis puniceicyclus]
MIARRPLGERGSFTFAIVFWALVTMMLAGLVVDGGLALTERQRAGDIAEQAARAGADDLNPDLLRIGTYKLVDGACGRATAVAAASGVDANLVTCGPIGSVTLPNGLVVPTITVTIQIHYTPILIGIVYSGNFIANASATAHPQPGP